VWRQAIQVKPSLFFSLEYSKKYRQNTTKKGKVSNYRSKWHVQEGPKAQLKKSGFWGKECFGGEPNK
jgi:hypothetical protein